MFNIDGWLPYGTYLTKKIASACFEHDLILLAISRLKFGEQQRYVYTNPSLTVYLQTTDILFLCGHRKNFRNLLRKQKCEDSQYQYEWTQNIFGSDDVVVEINLSPRDVSGTRI